jgi:hypothetical protein
MRGYGALIPFAIFGLACFRPPIVEVAWDFLQGQGAADEDSFSMMQTMAATQMKRHVRHESTRTFRYTEVPYTYYAVDESEVSDLPEDLSLGQLLAYDPKAATNDDIFVFLPGSWVECSNYTQLLETSGSSMKTLCLPYDNLRGMTEICGGNSTCWREQREIATLGSFDGVDGNNIVMRLQSALTYMAESVDKSWGAYLTRSGEPNYKKIRVSGHSQGAGGAAYLGYTFEVARVVAFAGPCDPDWPRHKRSATPMSQYFAFDSSYDTMCSNFQTNWENMGLTSEEHPLAILTEDNLTAYDAGKAQAAVALIRSPLCDDDGFCNPRWIHDSCAINQFVPPAPYARDGVWQKLMGI